MRRSRGESQEIPRDPAASHVGTRSFPRHIRWYLAGLSWDVATVGTTVEPRGMYREKSVVSLEIHRVKVGFPRGNLMEGYPA